MVVQVGNFMIESKLRDGKKILLVEIGFD